MLGRIKHVRPAEGFGFITSEDGEDRFFHCEALEAGMPLTDTLIGLFVEFIPTLHPKGPRAIAVHLIPHTPALGLPTGEGAC